MPTGYTADVCDGKKTTLREYALSCARAFGALIEMREAPPDAPIPDEIKADSYHLKEKKSAERELARLKTLSTEDAKREMDREYARDAKTYAKLLEEKLETNDRLEAMLLQVVQWIPPTKDHENFKTFMIEQLEMSLETWEPSEPIKRKVGEWLANKIGKAKLDIEYHSKHHAEGVQRAQERTKWIQALKKSL